MALPHFQTKPAWQNFAWCSNFHRRAICNHTSNELDQQSGHVQAGFRWLGHPQSWTP